MIQSDALLLSMAITNLVKQHIEKKQHHIQPAGLESLLEGSIIKSEVQTLYGKCMLTIDYRTNSSASKISPPHGPCPQPSQDIFAQPQVRNVLYPC